MTTNPRPSLAERFEAFVATLPGHENIDHALEGRHLEGMKRADYLFMNRRVIVEQKILQTDPSDRPQKYIERLARQGRLLFWGTRSTDSIFSDMPDGDKLKAEMFAYITKVLDADVARADDQTADTRQIFDIPHALGVVVFLNESAQTLIPDTIRYGLTRVVNKRHPDGNFRYPNNTGFIVITELHSTTTDGGTKVFPLMAFSHPNCSRTEEFSLFADMLFERWAAFNGSPLVESTHEEMFRAR